MPEPESIEAIVARLDGGADAYHPLLHRIAKEIRTLQLRINRLEHNEANRADPNRLR